MAEAKRDAGGFPDGGSTWASPESVRRTLRPAGSTLDDVARLAKLLVPDEPHVVRLEMGAKAWERARALFPQSVYPPCVSPPTMAAALLGVTVVCVATWGPEAVVALWSDGRVERIEG